MKHLEPFEQKGVVSGRYQKKSSPIQTPCTWQAKMGHLKNCGFPQKPRKNHLFDFENPVILLGQKGRGLKIVDFWKEIPVW